MKKLWYKILNKLIGAYVKEEISLFHIEMEKAIQEAKKAEQTVFEIHASDMSKNKKKKVLEKVKKELKKDKKKKEKN